MTRLLVLIATLLAFAFPALAAPKGGKVRVLYLDQSVGFVHAPVMPPKTSNGPTLSEIAMAEIGARSGAFTVRSTRDASTITPQTLKDIDVLVFYTTGALPIAPATWAAIQDWIKSRRGGFVGLHSATDTGWTYDGPGETYTAFINGKFGGHPWTQGTPITVQALGGAKEPMNQAWPRRFAYAEEIYQYADYDPAKVRVLQALDFGDIPLKRPWFVPITWTRQIGQGRLFYTNLGHTPSTWDDPRYRRQIVDAVRWTAGRLPGAAKPNPDEQALWALRSLLAYAGHSPTEIDQRAARLAKADAAWLREAAARAAALRPLWPMKPDSDRAPFDAAYSALLAEVLAKSAG
ncbi:glycosyl hydrolase [Caulobacter segnis]|uniref:Glycosyl hydrolase n=2 Tax=Caulobacter segnis TaxID=88688 RepID=D5VIT2_CAUST|nr:ThuA domain-containing protein [Caulobacter segnis]ADG09898.1 glycosyl hydrolase [Caulobacter segnis ATCC 21756]AVQ01657.1 glycosyl hydrolase [Caulobacter segnis]